MVFILDLLSDIVRALEAINTSVEVLHYLNNHLEHPRLAHFVTAPILKVSTPSVICVTPRMTSVMNSLSLHDGSAGDQSFDAPTTDVPTVEGKSSIYEAQLTATYQMCL